MTESSDSPCRHCPSSSRRAFLAEAAAALVSLGVLPQALSAMAIAEVVGERGAGSEVGYPIPPADGATIDKQNQVILARHQGLGYAFALSCPHQNTALRWIDDATGYQCPKHKSRYQPDGTFVSGRATRNMDRLPIRSDGRQLLVDVDRVYESDKDPAGWAAAVVKL
jgi:nitrite reductase/ring-hydroxylating ferredoxin subunit